MSRADNKEKYKEYDHQYYIKHKRPKSKIGQAEQQISDLEAKLAEKEKEIERLKTSRNCTYKQVEIWKHEFAVEQLELARRRIDRLGYNENKCLNKKDCIEDCLEEIDNQINKLKEKNND